MNKNAIKKFAIEARKKLIASVTDKAGMLGITPEHCGEAITKGADFEVYKTAAGTEVTLDKKQCEHRRKLVEQIRERGFDAVIEEVAYTWFNRICAIRFMEVNDYMYPVRVRVLSSEKKSTVSGLVKNEPDVVTMAPDIDWNFTDKEREAIIDAKMSGRQDDLFRMLFIKQCNLLHEVLPGLFEETDDYTEMLLNISFTNEDDVIRMLVDGIEESDFNITTTDENGKQVGQVEIIGWLYQYYISQKHDEIINIYKGTIKKEDIPAATQLFTTDWVVRYMVDNSLGRYWIERNPQSKLTEKLDFFVTPKNGEIKYVNERIEPTDLTFFDPCMGSGHILVYAFDVLMEIYRECGYSDRDAALSIVENNLYGMDIDKRAYQLAYFAVMMKARSYNRRALTNCNGNHLSVVEESNSIDGFTCVGLTNDNEQNKIAEYLIKIYRDAQEIGTLQTIKELDYKGFETYLNDIEHSVGQMDMFTSPWINETLPKILLLTKQAKIMSKKYDVVCTNPPYMNKLEGQLKKFVVDNYKEYSGDLFSVFIYRNFDYCKVNGYSAFMTPFVWMFIKTYEALRKFIIDAKSISTLIQMEYSAFEEATVPICSFVLQNCKSTEKTLCFRLSDFKGGMEVQRKKVLEALADKECGYFYEAEQTNFSKIPGSSVAYWISNNMYNTFLNGIKLEKIGKPEQGMATADNNRFVRGWYEVQQNKISLFQNEPTKWYPYNNGGGFRKWYGYNIDVVNWENNGIEIKSFPKSYVRNEKDYFKSGITWNAITSSDVSVRYFGEGFIFSNAGMAIFTGEKYQKYILAFINSCVCKSILKILSPTLNYNAGDMGNLPIIYSDIVNEKGLCEDCIQLSKLDWDSFETSWDFKKHPLIPNIKGVWNLEELQRKRNGENVPPRMWISAAYEAWEEQCDRRFSKLKANEEELNRIFIDIYGLQDELTPEVEDKDITVRKADLGRDIRSFISYAVGCMFGRYSLAKEGLLFAGGQMTDIYQYYSGKMDGTYVLDGRFPLDGKSYYYLENDDYLIDGDNIIPITDEEYFSDDIVTRFVDFVKTVYGQDTLEDNLDFIAQALGGKGDTSRGVIRNYFIKDFYADHLKVYQKRPIYWLFDSGKQNGFKALIYMHRYDADTVGRVRTDYLHQAQKYVESAMQSAQYTIENASSSSDKSKATKAVTKYTKQLAEMKIYDEAIAHIANRRIEIDLDDGVKVNYAKFQGVEVAQEGKKALKVDLLGKI